MHPKLFGRFRLEIYKLRPDATRHEDVCCRRKECQRVHCTVSISPCLSALKSVTMSQYHKLLGHELEPQVLRTQMPKR